jgi:predicted Fe-S protein YdhL (DUF1289 family)
MVENNEINHSEIAETKRLSDREKERVMGKLDRIYDQLQNTEFLTRIAIEELEKEVVPLIKSAFNPGDRFGFEQIPRVKTPYPFEVDTVSVWRRMDGRERQKIINAIGNHFGVDLGNSESDSYKEAIKKRYEEKRVVGVSSEGRVNVTALATNNPAIDIHVSEYEDARGKQYSLVRAESD